MKEEFIPLISKKSIWEHNPASYKEHIDSLYRDPKEGKPATKDFSIRINKKGNPVVTVRNRKPKWVTPEEISGVAQEGKFEERLVWVWLGERKIEVRRSGTQVELKV